MREKINTNNAPSAIGPYSQAIKTQQLVFLSGQIPLNPATMQLVSDQFEQQAIQVFENMRSVARAAGGDLNRIVKLTILLLDLKDFAIVNEVMQRYFEEPYPARSTFAVSGLPKDALVEIEAIMALD